MGAFLGEGRPDNPGVAEGNQEVRKALGKADYFCEYFAYLTLEVAVYKSDRKIAEEKEDEEGGNKAAI